MNRLFRRFVAGFCLITLGTVIAAAPVQAADTTGVGSAGGSSLVVGLDAGDLLKLGVIGESSSSTIDPNVGTPTATETLAPLGVSSASLPALDALTPPSVQTTSTGAADQKSTALIDLASLPQPLPVLSGAINPASLISVVDSEGAKAALTSTLANVGVLGSVLKVDSAKLDLGGIAAPAASSASRALTVDNVTVLDLRSLLNLVGLDLNLLPLSTLTALVDQLGLLNTVNTLTGQNFGSTADLLNAINTPTAAAQAAVNSAEAAVASATTSLNNAVAAASGLLCSVTPSLPLCQAVTAAQGVLTQAEAALTAAVAALNAALAAVQNLLDGLAGALELAPVLQLQGLQVGAVSTAVDTVAGSSANILASIGDIKVAGVDLGGIDANATLDTVQALAGQVTGQLQSLLGTISPQLANILSIKLFDRATSITQDGDYVKALAGITGLVLTVTPPDVCAVVNDLVSQLPGGLLGSGSLPGVSLPALPVQTILGQAGSLLPCAAASGASAGSFQAQALLPPGLPALTSPITLSAASVNSAAQFTAVASPQAPGSPSAPGLARTGMNEALLLFFGGLLAAVALGTRRVIAPARRRR